ncbi:MAG: N-acetyltransferase [Myxococcales bacterium]|nr:N-acetyltransferase [Myxococcales bacterium]
MIDVEEARASHGPALVALFRAAGCGCFCRYWHFTGTKNDWLARLAETPDAGAAELTGALDRGAPDGRGLVALDRERGEAVGWLKLCALAEVPKLRVQGAYRGLDLEAGGAPLAIGCVLVHPSSRRSGVAGALLAGAVARAQAEGVVLLGFPRRSAAPLYDEAAFAGPERAFEAAGFRVAHDSPAYPVYRFNPRE